MKEEPVDILDKQGKKTGQTLLKSKAHEQGLWHGAIHIWIYNNQGEVLLQRRSPKKILRPDIWDVSVGGHIGAGKDPLAAAVEEAEEELGLRINPKDLELIGTATNKYNEKNGWKERIYLWVYALRRDGLDIKSLKLEEAEISGVRWLTVANLQAELQNPALAEEYPPISQNYYRILDKLYKIVARDHK